MPMDATPLVRLRWRLRGAWLWPSFLVLSVADAVIIHSLPPAGQSASLIGGLLLGASLSLLGISLLGGVVGALVRRLRPDMPRIVARNYAGALIALAVTGAFLAAGIVHRPAIASTQRAVDEAVARAEDYIGMHAPAAFQHDLRVLETDPLEAPQIYRICVSDLTHAHYYCVTVNLGDRFGRGVHYSGSEPDSELAAGTG